MKKSASGSTAESSLPSSVSRIRVRYGETDAMGWVYYGNYYLYFEVGRSDLIRSIWKSYRTMEEEGRRLPVTESHCKYIKGVQYEDEIEVHTRISFLSVYRMRFDYEIKTVARGETAAVGYTLHCFVDEDGKPIRIPEDLYSTLNGS
ncbi:acyl-CoA thioesterase [bacterium]|nr:MAG: acyl-CoA thioesterase [bacterium]